MADSPPRRPGGFGTSIAFTSETRRKIILAVKGGNHLITAARFAGVTRETVRRWLLKGETLAQKDYESLDQYEKEYVDFFQEYEEADAQAEMVAVAKWRGFFDKDYKASRDFLARSKPDLWGSKVEVSITAKDEEILELLTDLDEIENDFIEVESFELDDTLALEAGEDEQPQANAG